MARTLLSVAAVVAIVQSVALGGDVEPVVGDHCTICVERRGVGEEYVGDVVLVDETWICLMSLASPEGIKLVADSTDATGDKRLFKRVGGEAETFVYCLPRAVATVVDQAGKDGQRPAGTGELPSLGEIVAVTFVQAGSSRSVEGKLAGIDAQQITVSYEVSEAQVRQIPLLGELPLLGRMFTSTTFSVSTVTDAVPLADTLAIRYRGKSPRQSPHAETDQ